MNPSAFLRIVLFALILSRLLQVSIYPLDDSVYFESCSKLEKKYRNYFDGQVLYGDFGATSQLKKGESFKKYNPANAFDGNNATSWVEGVRDEGIGETLAFRSSIITDKIGILPGYGTSRHFKLNNRIKAARLGIYSALQDATECSGTLYRTGELFYSVELDFRDSLEIQYFPLKVSRKSEYGYIITIEILSVYRGSRYNDTCIAEVVMK